jgi:hypothetical protein
MRIGTRIKKVTTWNRPGDHPAVTDINLHGGDAIQTDCGHRANEHGIMPVPGLGVYGVCPGSYVIETEDGGLTWLGKADFERLFKLRPWWQFW